MSPSPPLVAVLDYGIGNLRSAQKALERVGADARLTDDRALIADAQGVVLPGVGHFGRCMAALGQLGLDEVAYDAATSGRPFFGICVGMQLLYEGSDEASGVTGLGVLSGRVRGLSGQVKCPQMQWNQLASPAQPATPDEPAMMAGIEAPWWMYFVHSYAAHPADVDQSTIAATCDYGGDLVAAVEHGRVWATQFHPEKSGHDGLAVMANFVALVQTPTSVA